MQLYDGDECKLEYYIKQCNCENLHMRDDCLRLPHDYEVGSLSTLGVPYHVRISS
jgi:hypothetical protein